MTRNAHDRYAYWRSALNGVFGPVHDDDPQAGFYKKRRGKDGPWVAVAIWWTDDRYYATEDGKPVDASEVWTWVCRRPIGEDVFRRVERGEGWPDAIETMIGHNNPPADALTPGDVAEPVDPVEAALRAATAALADPVADQAACDRLANLKDEMARLWKAMDEKRAAEKRPHMDAAAAIDNAYRAVLGRIADTGTLLKKAITAWLLSEKARLEAEVLAEVLAKRRAEEAALAAEAAALAGDAGAPAPAALPLPPAEQPKVKAGTGTRAVSLRTYKSARIADYAAALAHFAGNAEVRAAVQSLADKCVRAGIDVPGVEVVTEQRAA